MNWRRGWIVGVMVSAGLAGCRTGVPGSSPRISTATTPDIDWGAYRTWAWARPPIRSGRTVNLDTLEVIDTRLRAAVERALAARGYQRGAGTGGDLRVDYDLRLREANTQSFQDYAAYRASGGTKDMGAAFVEGYLQGTLVVEFVDARTGARVWRGFAEGHIDDHNPGRRADDVAARLFADVPAR